MYKVTVKGEAATDYTPLEDLDGIDCQDCFSDYMDRGESCNGAVTGGYMRFKHEDGKLFTITEYKASRELTPDELHDIVEYTSGQWSDGIGEGFEQYPQNVDGEEVYISPWFWGQVPEVFQEKLA